MTDESIQNGEHEETAVSDPVAALLQKALATPPEPEIHFLPGVQERIRIRTRGRYFAARRARYRDPIILLLIAATLILLIGALVFVVLEPLVSPSPSSPGPQPRSTTNSVPGPNE